MEDVNSQMIALEGVVYPALTKMGLINFVINFNKVKKTSRTAVVANLAARAKFIYDEFENFRSRCSAYKDSDDAVRAEFPKADLHYDELTHIDDRLKAIAWFINLADNGTVGCEPIVRFKTINDICTNVMKRSEMHKDNRSLSRLGLWIDYSLKDISDSAYTWYEYADLFNLKKNSDEESEDK